MGGGVRNHLLHAACSTRLTSQRGCSPIFKADVYPVSKRREEIILPAAVLVPPVGGDQWRLVSIRGGQKALRVRLHRMAPGRRKPLFAPEDRNALDMIAGAGCLARGNRGRRNRRLCPEG